MPFASKIRKDALLALDQFIIPALQTQEILQILAEPPFDFKSTQYQIVQQDFLADKPYVPLQIEEHWYQQLVMSANTPVLMFAYDGVCDERIGITHQQAQMLNVPERQQFGGVNVLR